MAIYLDSRVLKADPEGTKIEREYAEGIQKVNKLFDKFRVKGSQTSYIQITRNIKDEDRIFSMTSKKLKRLPPIALPVEIPYYDEESGATLLRYSTTPPVINSEGKLTWGTKWLELRETMPITEQQKDLAWFLLFASSLIRKGVYQLVDVQAKYEGTYNEIMLKKEVLDYLAGDEELTKYIAQKFINEAMVRLEPIELFVKVNAWLEENKKWDKVIDEIKKFLNTKTLGKERISEIEWEGEPVTVLPCPAYVVYKDLKTEAKSLGIPMTVPPQSKDVIYSLIQHVKAKL